MKELQTDNNQLENKLNTTRYNVNLNQFKYQI